MQWMARRHGGMAAFYEKFTAPLEAAGVAAIRQRLTGDLTGRILEVGCGTGLNFPYYPAGTEVTAIEPLDAFRTFAAERATTVRAHITVDLGDAQALPYGDAGFDAVVCTLVFCSVPDAPRGLQEVRRVTRPGGTVRFFEHVRSDQPLVAAAQHLANPFWRWMTEGCNINRDTVTMVRAAGFTVDRIEAHDIRAPRAPHFPLREIHARA